MAFTNLTQDHLDYHQTFDAYFDAKSILFGEEYPASRVIGTGTEWGVRLAESCIAAGDDVATFGFDDGASIHPEDVEYCRAGTAIDLLVDGSRHHVDSPLVGKFNVENVMCAFGIGVALGVPADEVASALGGDCRVPGRLERVDLGASMASLPAGSAAAAAAADAADAGPSLEGAAADSQSAPGGGAQRGACADLPTVYVDYAHTPDALSKAISSVDALGSARTIVVFGCGGDRDREKRPLMGEASLAADFAIVTSDNPRTEDPSAIISDILGGMPADARGVRYEVIEDRGRAIFRAIEMADASDLVLIAGKGHEDYQELATGKVHFDDREQAALALAARISQGDSEGGAL